MQRIPLLSRRLLPALLAVTMLPTVRAQTKSTVQTAVSLNPNPVNSGQSAAIQGIASEVDRLCDRSVHADSQQLSNTDTPSNAEIYSGANPFGPPNTLHTNSASAAQWSPQNITNLSQSSSASSPPPRDSPAPTAVLPVGNPQPAAPDVPPDVLGLAQTMRAAAHARHSRRHGRSGLPKCGGASSKNAAHLVCRSLSAD
jgi:hypothetical protein